MEPLILARGWVGLYAPLALAPAALTETFAVFALVLSTAISTYPPTNSLT